MSDGAPPRRTFARVAPALLLLFAGFAGCSGSNFHIDLQGWKAGYAWEYDEKRTHTVRVSGTPPSSIPADEVDETENRTFRLEVFNSSAHSVEGFPIYAVGVLSRVLADPNASLVQTDYWDAWVFTEDLNPAQPTFLDWKTEEVQLSADRGSAENESDEPSEPYPANEHRLLDWPLTRNHKWVHEESVPGLSDDATGLLQGTASRESNVRVPAGTFKAVRLRAVLEPFDTSSTEAQIDNDLESQGGRVRSLSFRHVVTYDYAFAPSVHNVIESTTTTETTIAARGRDAEGESYDFTYRETSVIRQQLTVYQLLEAAQKPLAFALDIKRGVYSPKPIIPAAHFAVEIVANRAAFNIAAEDTATLGVRIYNSTAGEQPVRDREANYPVPAPAKPEYNRDQLEVVWSLQSQDLGGRFHEFQKTVADSLSLAPKDMPGSGLRQVQATLKLKDTPKGPGQEIFTDTVLFEVFLHQNLTHTRAATNVTPNELVSVQFPVEPTGRLVRVNATVQSTPPDAQCPVAGSSDCLAVADGANVVVQDQRGERMRFESTEPTKSAAGMWRASFRPSAPGNVVVFEVIVRYGPPR